MSTLEGLFDNNRKWAEEITREQPDFFKELAQGQSPEYLWIGCADSRVPANAVLQLPPGGLFVHRNVANLVVEDDPNCLSVIQYAVEALKVKHIIVCGHYGCGGVKAAMEGPPLDNPIDSWLQHIRDVYSLHREELDAIQDKDRRCDRFCELNVMAQVRHVARTPSVTKAWQEGQALQVHGWIYRLSEGLLKDLEVSTNGPEK